MCNLYSLTRAREAIRRLFRVDHDHTGNQPELPAIFPDQMAPVIRLEADGARVMQSMRWGFPCPPSAGAGIVTNVRNTASPHWRPWLAQASRCLVPATAFCEYTDTRPKIPTWFARDTARAPFAFAGIWRPWRGPRGPKSAPEHGEHRLFAFLTTAPNALVRPVHAKAMPVILTAAEADIWLGADTAAALALQRPAQEDLLRIVATGAKQDPP